MKKALLVSTLSLLYMTSTMAQDFFTVKISGVSSIIISMIDEWTIYSVMWGKGGKCIN